MAAALSTAAERKVAPSFQLNRHLTKIINRKTHRLLVRKDFLRVSGSAIRFVAPGFVLQKSKDMGDAPRYGLTATKKLGSAVVRNRARRRLRALAEQHLIEKALPYDYVLVAREAIIERPFTQLVADLEKALRVLKCQK